MPRKPSRKGGRRPSRKLSRRRAGGGVTAAMYPGYTLAPPEIGGLATVYLQEGRGRSVRKTMPKVMAASRKALRKRASKKKLPSRRRGGGDALDYGCHQPTWGPSCR